MTLFANDGSPPKAGAAAHSVHLDAMRGLAALAVVAFHVRLLFFVARSQIAPDLRSAASDSFYLATGLGREAVLAFFVLSGFLIATSVHRDGLLSRRLIGRYAVARLSRLYVVLLPALALGVLWDLLGLHLFPAADIYHGMLANGLFRIDVAARLQPANVIATTAFLQAIVFPSPGSSEQFWSLAYEFWCYALFPLAYLAFAPASRPWLRISTSLAAAVIIYLVGTGVFVYFGCWLLGAAIALAPPAIQRIFRRYSLVMVAAGVVCALLALFAIKQYGLRMPGSVFALAVSFALLVAGLANSRLLRPSELVWRCYAAAAQWLAQRSFSLYAIHVPLLVFLRAWCGNTLWQPTETNMALWAVLVGGSLIYADLNWRLAERHTPVVRRWLLGKFRIAPVRTVPLPPHSTR
ncbi:MAG: acyltransferase [Rhodospirillales bacterium]